MTDIETFLILCIAFALGAVAVCVIAGVFGAINAWWRG